MKKLLLSVMALVGIQFAQAQTTAQDWTLSDCSSNSHTLFTYLDAEEVVVMEFGMGCGSCYTAAAGLMDLKAKYGVEQPGKVNFFYMDYWSGNTCGADVDPMLATHDFDAGFINCNSQKTYYISGSPMPGIVIVAGSNHAVIYEKNSYANSDTTAMITAIDNFFATIGINENEISESDFNVFPNPSNGNFILQSDIHQSINNVTIEITDLTGKVVHTQSGITVPDGQNNLQISAGNLEAGHYLIRIIGEKAIYVKNVVMN